MIFIETDLVGAFLIDLEKIEDSRGYFARAWDAKQFAEYGLETRIVQANLSFNKRRGTLRGLHLQCPPHEEAKMIRCVRGALYDVIIDLRPDSPTYMGWTGVELTEENNRLLYVPGGFAHGFQTLANDTEAFYLVTEFYTPEAEAGVRWDDPTFAIEWPLGEPTEISDKDGAWPDFEPAGRSPR